MNRLEIIGVGRSDKGNIKKVNQDAYLCKIDIINGHKVGLFVVCDGLGGLKYGEVASSKTVEKFNLWFEKDLKEILKAYNCDDVIKESIEQIIKKSNSEIIEFSNRMGTKVGTTATVLFIINNKYYICHIGDSRVYKIDRRFVQLTEDHTQYEMFKKKGKISELKYIRKNVLTQCIGVNENLNIYVNKGYIKRESNFILCSDGFYNKMNKYKINKKLKNKYINKDLIEECCESFIEDIKKRKERDNITLLIVKVKFNKSSLLYRLKILLSR